jgi:urea transport system substrate-binding protein
VTSDAIEAAYNSVYLWAQAVVEAETDEVADVLKAIKRQSLNAPEGIVSVDDETHHAWRPVYVGRIRADGQFDLVWSSGKPVRPVPYPPSRTRPEWELFLESLYRSWGGWSNPRSNTRSERPEDGHTQLLFPPKTETAGVAARKEDRFSAPRTAPASTTWFR